MVSWCASVTFRKGARPLLWECVVTVLLASPATRSETLWDTSKVCVCLVYGYGPCLLQLLTYMCLGLLALWVQAKNTFLDLPKASMVCSCILIVCKVSACLWLRFLLVLERIFLSQALGLWCAPGWLARRQTALGPTCCLPYLSQEARLSLHLAFCGIFTSCSGSLHPTFIKWIVSQYSRNACIFF